VLQHKQGGTTDPIVGLIGQAGRVGHKDISIAATMHTFWLLGGEEFGDSWSRVRGYWSVVAIQVIDDMNHDVTRHTLTALVEGCQSLVTSNLIVGETHTLLRISKGYREAKRFLDRLARSWSACS